MAYHIQFSLFDAQGQRKYLNRDERSQFFAIANDRKRPDIRLFCLLLYYTGARISEIIQLTPISIDISNKAVTIRTLKRRRRNVFRQVPLPDSLLTDLNHYISTIGDEPLLWRFAVRSASRYIKAVMYEAGISGTKSSALGLRHGFAVHAIQIVPITQVQKWMGHASLQTTALYLNISGDEEREMAKRLWEG